MTAAPVLTRFGAHLRELRLSAGLTQEALAQAAGLTPKYISELENGKTNPSLIVIQALAEKGLDLSLTSFFDFDTSGNEAREQARELTALLATQPKRQRQRLMHLIRAFVDST